MPPPNSSGGRVPGFEGAGVVSGAGARIAPGRGLKPGLRMAFLPAPDSLRDEVVVQAGSVVRLLDSIPDEIGTQMLINTGAALTRMTPLPRSRTGVIVLITGAGSAVGRLVGKLLTDWGVKAGSVRSEAGRRETRRNSARVANSCDGGCWLQTAAAEGAKSLKGVPSGHRTQQPPEQLPAAIGAPDSISSFRSKN
jgi:NADPH:quinone reductase-like Zn-dependent oxidoreductase